MSGATVIISPAGYSVSPTYRVIDSFEDNTPYAPPSAYAATFSWDSVPAGDVSIQTTYAKTGTRSKRFRFLTTTDAVEQAFTFTPVSELWASFWLRVPDNYSHGVITSGSNNNKVIYFWMDDYSFHGDGSTLGIEMRPDGAGGSSYWYVKVSPGRYSVTGGDQGSSRFITVPDDLGRWMQVVINAKPETAVDASDGVVRIWRKWDGDSSFTSVYNFTGQPIRLPTAGPVGFAQGYVMGWSNGRYAATTDFYMDDFTIATGNIWGVT